MNGNSPSPDQVEQWILNSIDPTNDYVRRAAVQSLQHWTNSTGSAQAFPILSQLLISSHLQVRFHALTVLGSHNHVQGSEGAHNRSLLRLFLMQEQPSAVEPVFLLKKKAQILAAHMIHDGGSLVWPSVDSDLRLLASSNAILFLYTMISVLEEFQSVSQHQQNPSQPAYPSANELDSVVDMKTSLEQTRRLKDVLKGYHEPKGSSTTLLEQLFALVVQILESTSSQEVAQTAFRAIEEFLRWTDVSFLGVAVVRCFDLMLKAVLQTSNQTSKAAVRAFQEYTATHTPGSHDAVASPLDPNLVSRLLEQIHLSKQLPYPSQPGKKSTEAADVDGDAMELIISMASVINNIGLSLLFDTTAVSSSLWPQVLDLFLRCFAYDDIDVTTAVLPLSMRIVPLLATHQQQQLPLLLNTLYEQMKYPSDFSYNFDNDDEAEEEVFRTELCKVYHKLVQSCPATCLQFLCEAVNAQFTVDAATKSTAEIEATLRLVYHYSEGIRPPAGLKELLQNDTFRSLLQTIHKSNIPHHPNGQVLCLYYDTTVRYANFFTKNDGVLLPVLSNLATLSFSHAESHVRSRCCYLLLRLVKATLTLLSALVSSILEGIHSFLTQHFDQLMVEDVYFLYETMGLLIGKTNQSAVEQRNGLVAAMSPLMTSIEDHLVQIDALLPNGPELDAVYRALTASVAAVAHISKGFRKPSPEVKEVFSDTLSVVLKVLQKGWGYEPLRNKTMVYLHRMVQILGSDILKPVEGFLDILVLKASSDDILSVSQLLGSLCSSCGGQAYAIMDLTLLPFLQRCEALISQINDVIPREDEAPHVATERMAIQKLAYALLLQIVTNELSRVLVSQKNGDSFLSILNLVSQGAREHTDAIVRKSCVRIFRELMTRWVVAGKGEEQHNHQLLCFICQSLVPGFLKIILDKSFDRKDANNIRVFSEFCHLLQILKSHVKSNTMLGESLVGLPMPTATYAVLCSAATSQKEMERNLLQSLATSTS